MISKGVWHNKGRQSRLLMMIFLVMVAVGGGSAEAGPKHEFRRRELNGEWRFNANDWRGRIEFTREGDHFVGRVFFERNNRWEPLRDIHFDPDSGHIEFDRPEAHQHYEGRFVGDDRMEGHFEGGDQWWAERGDEHPAERQGLSGEWRINANDWRGRVEFSREGDHYAGRVFFDRNNRWEPLRDIHFDRDSGHIEFDRPEAQQQFRGRFVRDNRIEGDFEGGGGGRWFAER